jgi:hypothetical protein
MITIQRKTTRRAVPAILTALILAVQIAIQAVAATPAAAAPPPGMIRTVSADKPANSDPSQIAIAFCPEGMLVTGGGAFIWGGNGKVRLTRLQPFHFRSANYYATAAEEPDTGYDGEWRLQAYAICVASYRVPGYEETLPRAETDESSSAFQTTSVGCPGNKKVIGTGAIIRHANGQVGLHLVRPAGPLDIARASAREDADGYAQDWSLVVYAVCADRIESAAVYGTVGPPGNSGGTIECPPGKFVYSVGGGGGLVESGPVHLWASYMDGSLTRASVSMTGPPNGGPAIGAICAF